MTTVVHNPFQLFDKSKLIIKTSQPNENIFRESKQPPQPTQSLQPQLRLIKLQHITSPQTQMTSMCKLPTLSSAQILFSTLKSTDKQFVTNQQPQPPQLIQQNKRQRIEILDLTEQNINILDTKRLSIMTTFSLSTNPLSSIPSCTILTKSDCNGPNLANPSSSSSSSPSMFVQSSENKLKYEKDGNVNLFNRLAPNHTTIGKTPDQTTTSYISSNPTLINTITNNPTPNMHNPSTIANPTTTNNNPNNTANNPTTTTTTNPNTTSKNSTTNSDHLFGSLTVSPLSSTPYSDATSSKRLSRHVARPMNAFILWSQFERKRMALTSNSEVQNCEVSRRLGQRWRRLCQDERKPFVEEAERLRQLHKMEYPDYKYKPRKRRKRKIEDRQKGKEGEAQNENLSSDLSSPESIFSCDGTTCSNSSANETSLLLAIDETHTEETALSETTNETTNECKTEDNGFNNVLEKDSSIKKNVYFNAYSFFQPDATEMKSELHSMQWLDENIDLSPFIHMIDQQLNSTPQQPLTNLYSTPFSPNLLSFPNTPPLQTNNTLSPSDFQRTPLQWLTNEDLQTDFCLQDDSFLLPFSQLSSPLLSTPSLSFPSTQFASSSSLLSISSPQSSSSLSLPSPQSLSLSPQSSSSSSPLPSTSFLSPPTSPSSCTSSAFNTYTFAIKDKPDLMNNLNNDLTATIVTNANTMSNITNINDSNNDSEAKTLNDIEVKNDINILKTNDLKLTVDDEASDVPNVNNGLAINKSTEKTHFVDDLENADWTDNWPMRDDDLDLLMDCFPPEVTELVTSCCSDQHFKRFCSM